MTHAQRDLAFGGASCETNARPQACRDCPVGEQAFCAQLDEPAQSYYRRHVSQLRVGRNTPILTGGRPHHRLLILTQGVARVSRTLPNGNRQVLAFHFPGDIVSYGDYDTIWEADLDSVTACRLCSLEHDQAETLRRLSPSLDRELLAAAKEQIKRQQRHMLDLGRTTAVQRLAGLLLALAGQSQPPDMPAGCFAIPMGRAEIADYLILQVETVSRSFAKLVQMGAIELPKPTRVRLLDRAQLCDLADGTETA